jgi:hypothetical protein
VRPACNVDPENMLISGDDVLHLTSTVPDEHLGSKNSISKCSVSKCKFLNFKCIQWGVDGVFKHSETDPSGHQNNVRIQS